MIKNMIGVVAAFIVMLTSTVSYGNTNYVLDKNEYDVIVITDKNEAKYLYNPVDYNVTGKYKKYIDISQYDDYFRKYAKMYFGYGFDSNWFKAQSVAESNLGMSGKNERIKSSVGAMGLMQIMPKTWEEITQTSTNKYMKGHSVFEAEYNIAAGIYYDYKMGVIWKSERPFEDWLCFIFASYNAGAGNILRAQKLVDRHKSSNLWRHVAEKLPLITGRHSEETFGYVTRIFEIKGDLK